MLNVVGVATFPLTIKTNRIMSYHTQLQNQRQSSNEAFERKVEELQTNQALDQKAFDATEEVLKQLSATLESEHLEIVNIHMSRVNLKVKLDMKLKPTSGKVKFIKSQGYTSSGSGKNQKRLNEKAKKYESILTEPINCVNAYADVNPYSFEINDKDDEKRILVNLYFIIK